VKLPPLLSEHPRPLQFVFVVAVPAVYGAITGYFLGVSEVTYLVLSVLGVVGGIGAGLDHATPLEGTRRGALGGLIFGSAILVAHEIHGADATAHLPDPEVILAVLTTALGALFGAIGGWLRARSLAAA
jgi:hypothetical protein